MTFELFVFDSQRDEIIIDNAIMFEIGALNKVWTRKSVMKGDEKGEKKLLNKKELMYIFFMANWTKKNPYRAEGDVKKDKEARAACDFPTGWKPDVVVLDAIEMYKRYVIDSTPTLKFLVQLEEAILQTADQLEMIKHQNEVLLNSLKEAEHSVEATVALGPMMVTLRENLKMMFSMLKDVKAANTERKSLEKDYSDEMEGSGRITGGKKLGNRENPLD